MAVLGIDATNIRAGGGLTHLLEILGAVNPMLYGFDRVVVWGSSNTLAAIQDRSWLIKKSPLVLDGGLFKRTLWQKFHLSSSAKHEGCDVLFIPGGSFAGSFSPVILMSQNLLPFEWRELVRYGISCASLKFVALRFMQTKSFKRAAGIIFLTKYAQEVVCRTAGLKPKKFAIIAHGFSNEFRNDPNLQLKLSEYSSKKPFRILYVSTVDHYKHQWNVVKAVAKLRKKGLPVHLDLVGGAYAPALKRLNLTIQKEDPCGDWVQYCGEVEYRDLHKKYFEANLGVWASTCEAFGIILLETMASGLPIACSDRGTMREILGDGGEYFDAENPDDIARALLFLIERVDVRRNLANIAHKNAQQYSWGRCADETFKFMASILRNNT